MAKHAEKEATTSNTDDVVHCFVCDVTVTGRYYTLATCRTQSTRIRLIEKLGQLVGERYMVVISEEDIICRGCANLINTLDRLESEMGSVRNVVLRFLEKKYSLDEGELVNDKSTGPGLPPRITPSASQSSTGHMRTKSSDTENFMARKRKAALSDLENERENGIGAAKKKLKKDDSKNDLWMQCDKCKYTTHYNSFMIHHIRQHIKKKTPLCDYCGEDINSESCARQCGPKKTLPSTSGSEPTAPKNKLTAKKSTTQIVKPEVHFVKEAQRSTDSESETVEMIAAEINEFSGSNRMQSPDVVISTVQAPNNSGSNLQEFNGATILPTIPEEPSTSEIATTSSVSNEMTIEVSGMSHQQAVQHVVQQAMSVDNLQMGNTEGSGPTAICVMEMSEENSADEPTLLTVQKMEDDSNAVYVQVVEMGKGVGIDGAGNVTKQVLTVAEDGTVEMVEVMWDEMVPPDVESEQDIQF